MSEICQRYQISRPTGFRRIARIREEGLEAIEDRSRAPDRHPNRTPEKIEREILVLREKYGWGAKKPLLLGNALAHDYIGREEVDDGIWNILYYNTMLGRINLKT